MIAGVILVVVVLVVAGIGYFGLQAIGPTKHTTTSCVPASDCTAVANDVELFSSNGPTYGEQYAQVSAGEALSVTVLPTGSETVKTFSVAWGDGTSTSASNPTLTHAYTGPGLYVMAPSVVDTSGLTHTGTGGLFSLDVNLSFANESGGQYPSISTTFTNGTSGGDEPWVAVGSTVSVGSSYIGVPPSPGWSNGPMSITYGTGVIQKSYSSGASSVSGSYAVTQVGTENITLHGSSIGPAGASNPFTYTWGIYVAPSATGLGCKFCLPSTSATSPHPDSIVAYEVAPGGAYTIDPAGDYYTVGEEVSANIFQDLVAYNGTDLGTTYANYIPEIAACVPGSPQCTSTYGSDLINGYNWTFVIAKTAKFYDPTTGVSWNVYPSDVFFSFVRQMAFSTLPAVGVNPGWIEGQALLPAGNPSWDGGIHGEYNNTPQYILNSMLVNDSAFCPASAIAGTSGDGCITFVANGSGRAWPAFLSYLAHGTAGNIVSAGWYIAHGATAPGFTPNGGDFPVALPGGVTSTSSPGFQSFVASQGPTSWDPYESIAETDYPTLEPGVAFSEVGSGPYALISANSAIGYVLKANPGFEQPSGCAGETWCQPAFGSYAKTVTVYWEVDDTAGIQAVQAGQADVINFEDADAATVNALVQKGALKLAVLPTMDTFDFAYSTDINLAGLKTYDPYPVNIQSNTLSYIGLRGFLDAAYPDASVQDQFNQIDGLQLGFNYGGFIPEYMGDFYPTNISWPNYDVATGQFGNPSASTSTVGSAGWYWAQLTNPSSSLYDPQFGSGGYSASSPLHIPALYDLGDPTHQSVLDLWSDEVQALSGGAVVFDVYPVESSIVYSNLQPDGQAPWALWFVGWVPDYAQPYDEWEPYGSASGSYSAPDTLLDTFTSAAFDQPSACGHSAADVLANLLYWADQPYIPNACQGVAYQVALYWATDANTNPNAPQCVLEWNRVSSIYNLLNLYQPTLQQNEFLTVGPWVNAQSANANAVNGWPGAVFNWWSFQGNGVS
jgi:hypothetical protein